MKKVLLTSAVVLTAFGAYNVANAQSVTVPSITANTDEYVQTLKQKIELVRTGYKYYDTTGTEHTEAPDVAKANALTAKVNAVQNAVNVLTQRQNKYKTVYTRYHDALKERQEREAKLEGLKANLDAATAKLNTLLISQKGFENVDDSIKTERTTLEADKTNSKSIAAAEADVALKEADLNRVQTALNDYKASHATQIDYLMDDETTAATDNQYDRKLKAKQDAVDNAVSALKDSKATLATRSARLEQVYTLIDQNLNVDFSTQYAIHQAKKDAAVTRKAKVENETKLAAVKELVDGGTATVPVGLKGELDTLTGTAAGSIEEAKGNLRVASTAAEAEFTESSFKPKAAAIGLTYEFDKIKAGVEEVIAQNPVKPAETPAKPATQAAWVQSGSSWWYKHADGSYTTNGWEKINGTWYYFDQAGWMATGWVKDNGTWYYLKDNGAMATGWVKDNGTWYYLKDNGAMATGWYKVADKWYYSYASGALAVNTTVDGYTVNGNGEWV